LILPSHLAAAARSPLSQASDHQQLDAHDVATQPTMREQVGGQFDAPPFLGVCDV
jgi:hypothetical protein